MQTGRSKRISIGVGFSDSESSFVPNEFDEEDFVYLNSLRRCGVEHPQIGQGSLQCGDVLLSRGDTDQWRLILKCLFCEQKVDSLGHFQTHILEHLTISQHELESLEREIKREQSEEQPFVVADHDVNIKEEYEEETAVSPPTFEELMMEESSTASEGGVANMDEPMAVRSAQGAHINEWISRLPGQETDDASVDEFLVIDDQERSPLSQVFHDKESPPPFEPAEKPTVNLEIEVLPTRTPTTPPTSSMVDEAMVLVLRGTKRRSPSLEPIETPPRDRSVRKTQLIYKKRVRLQKPERGKPYEGVTYNEEAHDGLPYVCDTCGKGFRLIAHVKAHLKRHLPVKPFACDMCEATFSESSNLKVHRNRHLGIKPYSCSHCPKAFTSSTEMKLHERTHTGYRPFVCNECGKAFLNSAHLTGHLRRHTNERPYSCDICDKRFFDRKLLRDHEVGHSTDRPFVCLICNATFPRRKALREHNKLHMSVKRYACTICSKAFAQNAGLYSHMRKSHTSVE